MNEARSLSRKNILLIAIFVAIAITLIATTYVKLNAQPFKEKDVKIAVITRGASGFIHEYFAGARHEGESMGITVDTFSANHNLDNLHYLLVEVKNRKYDGVIVSQFKSGGATTVEDIKQLIEAKIPVVAFSSDSELSNIRGVTMTSQNHVQMAKLAFDNMQKQLKGKGNIIYLSMDDYPELMARHKVYEQFLSMNPEIKEIERFGLSAPDPSIQTKDAVAAMLKKHGRGKVDAIVAIREAFARGAAQAVKEAGRHEVKIYSMGSVHNSDLQAMQEKDSSWVSTTGVDSKEMGAINVRLLLKKIAGEDTPTKYEFRPSLITQDELRLIKGATNTKNLQQVITNWGDNRDFEEDWMWELKREHKRKLVKGFRSE